MPTATTSARIDPVAGPGSDLLRLPAVVSRTGLGRSTIYRLVAQRQFPRPVRLTARAVGWRVTDLDRWSASLPPASQ